MSLTSGGRSPEEVVWITEEAYEGCKRMVDSDYMYDAGRLLEDLVEVEEN